MKFLEAWLLVVIGAQGANALQQIGGLALFGDAFPRIHAVQPAPANRGGRLFSGFGELLQFVGIQGHLGSATDSGGTEYRRP